LHRFDQGPRAIVDRHQHGHERPELRAIGRKAMTQHAGVVAPPRAIGRSERGDLRLAQRYQPVRMPAEPRARDVGADQRIGPCRRRQQRGQLRHQSVGPVRPCVAIFRRQLRQDAQSLCQCGIGWDGVVVHWRWWAGVRG
jgi:hypothetical protein